MRLGACQTCGHVDPLRALQELADKLTFESPQAPVSENVPSRDDVLEEAADICDQHLDEFSGTTCVYRCDVADAIRKLKSATTPQTAEAAPASAAAANGNVQPSRKCKADTILDCDFPKCDCPAPERGDERPQRMSATDRQGDKPK